MGNRVHPYQPGDEIWVKDGKKEPLLPVWTGPHMVILAVPTVVKVIGVIPCIHHTRVKKAAASCDEDTWKAVQDPQNLLKVQLQRQQPSPMKNTKPCSSHTLAAGWSTHGRSLRIRLSININGFSLSTLVSTPNQYYCCALHYRTN